MTRVKQATYIGPTFSVQRKLVKWKNSIEKLSQYNKCDIALMLVRLLDKER